MPSVPPVYGKLKWGEREFLLQIKPLKKTYFLLIDYDVHWEFAFDDLYHGEEYSLFTISAKCFYEEKNVIICPFFSPSVEMIMDTLFLSTVVYHSY